MAVNDRLVEVELENGQRRFVPVANTIVCSTIPSLTQLNTQMGSALNTKPSESGATWLAQNCSISPPSVFSQSIEAEAVTSGTGSSYADSGASGGQIRGNYGSAADFLEYALSGVPSSGSYNLALAYQTNFEDGIATGTLLVNNGTGTDFTLPARGGGKGILNLTVTLQAGTNTIRIQGKNTGDGHSFLQDKITVSTPT